MNVRFHLINGPNLPLPFDEKNITVEKGRWGRFYVIKGRKKVQLPKETDPKTIDLKKAEQLLKK